MSGYELARALRREATESLLLVAVTGYGAAADKQNAKEAGFDCHMTKPIEPSALAGILNRVGSLTG